MHIWISFCHRCHFKLQISTSTRLLLETLRETALLISESSQITEQHKQTNKNISSSERLVSCRANINSSVCSCACNCVFSSESRKDELQRLGLVL